MLVRPARAARFLERAKRSAAGFMGYYWGSTPQELRATGELRDGITADHIEMMAELAATLGESPPARAPGAAVHRASITALRLSREARDEARAFAEARWAAGELYDFDLTVDYPGPSPGNP